MIQDSPDFLFGLQVNHKIIVGLQPVAGRLPVLAHHDNGGRKGCLQRHEQVHQDKRIRIPMFDEGRHIQNDPKNENQSLPDNEAPGTNGRSDPICRPFALRGALVEQPVDILDRRMVMSKGMGKG